MFTHNLAEQNQFEIEIKDLDFQSVSLIVDYLYSSRIEINNDNVQELLTACSILQVMTITKIKEYIAQPRIPRHWKVDFSGTSVLRQ